MIVSYLVDNVNEINAVALLSIVRRRGVGERVADEQIVELLQGRPRRKVVVDTANIGGIFPIVLPKRVGLGSDATAAAAASNGPPLAKTSVHATHQRNGTQIPHTIHGDCAMGTHVFKRNQYELTINTLYKANHI